jgi:cellulose synthase/poly-beta-1,6-N-acetylglucosamine synthase-like glycosyltransferase
MSLVWEAILLLPIGLIGIYRWSVWVFKKVMGLSYKPEPPGPFPEGRVSIVTPVYDEDPPTFRMALESWKQNRPLEVIAVIDESDQACARIFEEMASTTHDVNLRLIMTSVPGKRPALARGIGESQGEIVALVDSDTIWEPDCIARLVAPFADPNVGGVTCRQSVYNPRTLAQKFTELMFDIRYEEETRFLGVMDQGFTCLSGRTAVYRRSALVPIVPGMLSETFWGKPSISGEDKQLTYLLQASGYKTKYQSNVTVYTHGPEKLRTLIKQKIRWTRNSWRADLRVLTKPWVWKRPALAFYLLDRCISAFTVLIAPVVWSVALYLGLWSVVYALPAWWLVSRSIKTYPYLKRHPLNIWMVPLYVLSNFVFGFIKVYSLATISRQGWLTRGARRAAPGLVRRFAGRTAEALVVTGLFSVVLGVIAIYAVAVLAHTSAENVSQEPEVPARTSLQDAAVPTQTPPQFLDGTPEDNLPGQD